jgi:hypothetical protein
MIHNYNANLDTRENRELLNRIFQIQLVKDKFYVPNDIQPNIFSHDLLFGQVREGEGSSFNQRQFSLPVRDAAGSGSVYSGNEVGGALISNGRLASHEAIYLEDEMERGHPKRQTPFLGKRGEHSLANGVVRRGGGVLSGESANTEFSRTFARQRPKGGKKGIKSQMGEEGAKTGSGVFRAIIPKAKKGGSVATKSAMKQNVREKIKALPMKKLTGQFSILNKVI